MATLNMRKRKLLYLNKNFNNLIKSKNLPGIFNKSISQIIDIINFAKPKSLFLQNI